MSQVARIATVEVVAGARMEPELQLTNEQWGLTSDLFGNPDTSPQGGRPRQTSTFLHRKIRTPKTPFKYLHTPNSWMRLDAHASENAIFSTSKDSLLVRHTHGVLRR